jgi:glutamate racemase
LDGSRLDNILSPPRIGIFDSGVGGISVLNEIRKRLPTADLVYVADSAHVPYGEKSPQYIQDRSKTITRFLISKGMNIIVVACNTATAAAVANLRSEFSLPIIGMEPAIKPAMAATRSGIVGVLATTGTLASAKFAALLERYQGDKKVITEPCPGWVNAVENGQLSGSETENLVIRHVQPLILNGADVLILGCTHYPFLRPLIEKIAGVQIAIVDTGAAVAKQVCLKLNEIGYPPTMYKEGEGKTSFFTSGDPINTAAVMTCLSQDAVLTIQKLPIEFA